MTPPSSLGFSTDLMLLALQGSTIERCDGYLAVSTPSNPDFHWGNFLLLDQAPAAGTAGAWVDTFARHFPGSAHVSIGVDGTGGAAGAPGDLASALLEVELGTVLTARRLRHPSRPNREADFRQLGVDDDGDWQAAVGLRLSNSSSPDPAAYATFSERRLAAMRQMQRNGRGAWFGAYLEGNMVSALGIFSDGSDIARYQSVDTHPDFRKRGLAGMLVHLAGEYAISELSATRLVIVADPGDPAIRLYRALGFAGTEIQTRLDGSHAVGGRAPREGSAPPLGSRRRPQTPTVDDLVGGAARRAAPGQ